MSSLEEEFRVSYIRLVLVYQDSRDSRVASADRQEVKGAGGAGGSRVSVEAQGPAV